MTGLLILNSRLATIKTFRLFLSLRIMKGFFFNLVFCMKTNPVLLAACGCMHARLHAWMCPVNTKAWPGPSIFCGCFGLDCISYSDMRCCTRSFVSRITKTFPSGAACQCFSVIAQPKVPAHPDKSSVAANAKEMKALLASTSTDLRCWFLQIWTRPCPSG